jgi:hypothetical protein
MFASRESVEGSQEPADDQGSTIGQERAWALSQLVARHTAADQEVVAFRAKHLPAGLLPWPDVETWINNREEDGERTSDITFTIPVDTTVEFDAGRVTLTPPLAVVPGWIGRTAWLCRSTR